MDGEGRARSVVWGTGGMVPCGMALPTGTVAGIVVGEMGASVAARVVELLVGGGVARAAATTGGNGVAGGRAMSFCSATVASVDTESTGGGD